MKWHGGCLAIGNSMNSHAFSHVTKIRRHEIAYATSNRRCCIECRVQFYSYVDTSGGGWLLLLLFDGPGFPSPTARFLSAGRIINITKANFIKNIINIVVLLALPSLNF